MAALSDNLLIVTILAYLGAMMLHTAQYALGKSRVLVGAGGPQQQEKPEPRYGTWAIYATYLAAAAHLGTVVTRAIAAERLPWGNMYEFLLTVTLIGTLVWLATVHFMPELRFLGIILTLVEVLLVGVAGLVLHTPIGPLVPALDSYWFVIHIAAVTTASGLFLVGFCASVMYLIRAGYDNGKRGGLYPLGAKLVSAEAAERLSFRMHAFGFPIWTFGVAAGAVWAEAAWGRYWGWDPKETWAFISWVVYACYLHARATPSVKRNVVAIIAIIGWATMLMNLFGVNIFFTGLHSYAGVE